MLLAKLEDITRGFSLGTIVGNDLKQLKENAKLRAGFHEGSKVEGMFTNTTFSEFRCKSKQDGVYEMTLKSETKDTVGNVRKYTTKYRFIMA